MGGYAINYFLDQETHYALERQGKEFCDRTFQDLTPEQYRETRDQVLGALVRKAIDYFTHQEREENYNLRGDLKEWI